MEYSKTLPEGHPERKAVVPLVTLDATGEGALRVVRLEDLKGFEAGKGEVGAEK